MTQDREYDNLPTFEECKMAVDCMTNDPIESFIYEYEPAGKDAEGFRIALRKALYYFCTSHLPKKVSIK